MHDPFMKGREGLMNYQRITSDEIFMRTLEVVAPLPCQEDYLKRLAAIFAFHIHKNFLMDEGYLSDDLPSMSAMIVAPTGQGKTFLLRKMAEVSKQNLITIDCSALAAEGWKGVGLGQRLYVAQKETTDQNAFERSILFLDEVDKLRLWGTDSDQGNPMSNILQLYNSGRITAEGSGKTPVSIDVSRFTVLIGGAFEGIDEIVQKRLAPQSRIGFTGELDGRQSTPAENVLQVTKDDLATYGMIPELLGRAGMILTIPLLKQEDYKQILQGGKGSIQYQYHNYLKGLYGVCFELTDAAVNCIAQKCLDDGSGARAVTPIMNEVMGTAIMQVERNDRINRVCLDADGQDLCIHYDYGKRQYCYCTAAAEEQQTHWIKAKSCEALAKKLCRYFQKAGSNTSAVPVLRAFLECSLEYLERNCAQDDFSFSGLERLARSVRPQDFASKYELMMCDQNLKAFRKFQELYTDHTQRDLVIALQEIMNYLERYHGSVTVRFKQKK